MEQFVDPLAARTKAAGELGEVTSDQCDQKPEASELRTANSGRRTADGGQYDFWRRLLPNVTCNLNLEDVWQGKDLRDFWIWVRVCSDARRLIDRVDPNTKQVYYIGTYLSIKICCSFVTYRLHYASLRNTPLRQSHGKGRVR